MRFDGAMLFVKDLGRMTAFYQDVIGLKPVEATRLSDWVEFEADGARFSLHAIPRDIAEGIEISHPPAPRETGPCKVSFALDDLDAALARLSEQGLTLLLRPWGATEAVDPEGNVIGLRQAGA